MSCLQPSSLSLSPSLISWGPFWYILPHSQQNSILTLRLQQRGAFEGPQLLVFSLEPSPRQCHQGRQLHVQLRHKATKRSLHVLYGYLNRWQLHTAVWSGWWKFREISYQSYLQGFFGALGFGLVSFALPAGKMTDWLDWLIWIQV